MRAIFAIGDIASARKFLKGRHALMSFAYWGTSWLEGIEKHAHEFASLVIDSGAFTIWNREQSGKSAPGGITIKTYADFLKWQAPKHELALSLDVIGNAQASLDQYLALLDEMKRPREILGADGRPFTQEAPSRTIVPIYHEGDPLEHLDAYCASSDLVALGRIEGRRSKPRTFEFYDLVFNRFPHGKFWALGNSSPDTLECYPFHCFDSTGWQRNSAYSNALGWPYNRCSKETRIVAHIEATETIAYNPPKQLTLRIA